MAARQQRILMSSRNAQELNNKFDVLEDDQDFHSWFRKVRSRLQHEAWENILGEGEPYVTNATNKTLSNKLSQRLLPSIPAPILDAIGVESEFDNGRGLELLQAIIQHFVPSKPVNLPSIYREWAQLQQKQNEPATTCQHSCFRIG